jgi:hypothetical protein
MSDIQDKLNIYLYPLVEFFLCATIDKESVNAKLSIFALRFKQ